MNLALWRVVAALCAECGEGGRHFSFRADFEMNVVALQNAAGQIGLVRIAAFEPFKGGLLVAEGFEEGKGESRGIERRFRQLGNSFFDFDCIHDIAESASECEQRRDEPFPVSYRDPRRIGSPGG